MTKEELILKGKAKVRGNSDLMHIYINLFMEQFGYKPNCAGCTFNNDWIKFTGNFKGTVKRNKPIAEDVSFKYRPKGDIIFYRIGDKTFRTYDNKISEQFAIDYLTHGTEKELSLRRKEFEVLPIQKR